MYKLQMRSAYIRRCLEDNSITARITLNQIVSQLFHQKVVLLYIIHVILMQWHNFIFAILGDRIYVISNITIYYL